MIRNAFALLIGALACIAASHAAAARPHEHAVAGPHGGQILELGVDQYHAEVVIDEKKDLVTVYILDGEAKEETAIDLPAIHVNVRLAGKPVQFALPAVRSSNDGQGPASCFRLKSPRLIEALHAEHANPRLALRIGKKSFVAKIAHSHEHETSHR